MTAPSPRPKHRWFKPAAYLAKMGAVGWCVLATIEQHQLDRRIREWTSLALQRDLLFSDQSVCMISGYELKPVGRVLLGRRHVMVVAYRDTDVDAILTMPECPGRLIVTTGSILTAEHRERSGAENVD